MALVQSAGHLLTKDDLLAQVWPGLVVEEVNLSVNVSALRKVLAESPGGSAWIETVARQGYRFNAPVDVGDVATENLAALRGVGESYAREAAPSIPPRIARRRLWIAATGAIASILALGLSYVALRERPSYASVAVLPFSTDAPANAYLADGIVEGVINGLTPVRSLRETPADPASIGRSLEVAAVVTGRITRTGNATKVQVELIDVARNAQVWSTSYEAESAGIAQLHARVARDLAHAMRVAVTDAERSLMARPPTANVGAYQAYLQARFLWNQRSESSLPRAIEQFRRAIDLDPGFALAHAGLADAYTTLGYLGYLAPVSTFPVARPHALKAIELDPSLAEPHASLGYIKFYFDWDWTGARDEFRRAIELNPNDPVSHQWNAVYLLAAGRSEEAFGEVKRAQQLDPLSLAINTDIGFHHYYNARYPEAIAQLRSVLGMNRDFALAHLWLGRAYLQVGRLDEALAETTLAEGRLKDWPVIVAARGFTYGVARRPGDAQAVLREMHALSAQRFVTAYGVALVHAGLGEKDDAFRWLDKAFDERSHWLVWLRLDPRWKNLRDDPRFAALVERLKYPG